MEQITTNEFLNSVFETEVWKKVSEEETLSMEMLAIEEADDLKAAQAGIDALEAFIKEIGMPTRWSEMGITDKQLLRAAADTAVLTPGCCHKFTRDEIYDLLSERM